MLIIGHEVRKLRGNKESGDIGDKSIILRHYTRVEGGKTVRYTGLHGQVFDSVFGRETIAGVGGIATEHPEPGSLRTYRYWRPRDVNFKGVGVLKGWVVNTLLRPRPRIQALVVLDVDDRNVEVCVQHSTDFGNLLDENGGISGDKYTNWVHQIYVSLQTKFPYGSVLPVRARGRYFVLPQRIDTPELLDGVETLVAQHGEDSSPLWKIHDKVGIVLPGSARFIPVDDKLVKEFITEFEWDALTH